MSRRTSKWLLKSARVLPVSLQALILRRAIDLPLAIPSELRFKIAETTDELEAAFGLVYDEYLRLGYCAPNPMKWRATIYHALPTTTTLLALYGNRVVGTLTLVRDNRLGLPLDKVFDVSILRREAGRLAEVTSLVIHRDFRRQNGGAVLFPLLRLMYEYSTSHFGVDHLVVSIHPKDEPFYKSLLLFRKVPGTRTVQYMGAPAVALHLDLHAALRDYQRVYSASSERKNLFDFFVRRTISNVELPQRIYNQVNDRLVTLDYFRRVFVDQLGVVAAGIPAERRAIETALTYADPARAHPRLEVNAPAKLQSNGEGGLVANIKDVSRNGFRAYFNGHFTVQPEFKIRIEVGKDLFSTVTAKAVWISPERGVGFEIIEADAHWHGFIDFLYKSEFGRQA